MSRRVATETRLIRNTTLQARITGESLNGISKGTIRSQLVKTNRALVDYAVQLTQDDLLPKPQSEKAQKAKQATPRRIDGKASGGHIRGRRFLNWQNITLTGELTARHHTPECSFEDIV